jgi:hypothetical protein
LDNFKVEILKTQENDSRDIYNKLENLNHEIGNVKDESNKNDKLLEKSLTDLIADFK